MRNHADSCSEWRSLASCQLDGELDELQTARLERHLAACAECTAWKREVSALAGLLHEAEPVAPSWTFERAQVLRRRFMRAALVSATAASAAAVAAFGMLMPGSGISIFSSASGRPAAAPPCASCTKKLALTTGVTVPAVAPIHVAHPLERQ